MPAPPEVLALVERYQDNQADYQKGGYKEFQVRKEFIDPLFRALGWDMDNTAGYAEAYKDVVHEDALKVGGTASAPDYSFRVGGVRKFFVEAKKPSVNVKEDVSAAYQLRRYAWSAKLPLSILTDFAEFAVYDTRVRPAPSDKPSTARIQYFAFEEYDERWDEIAGVFSKEAVLKGSFDRYAVDTSGKKGTAEVDIAFLRDIERWRELLAKNIALRNKSMGLSHRDLNYAVQSTLDRIVFLRICEDRGLEKAGALADAAESADVYASLFALFDSADRRYNSGLFHFHREKGRTEEPDELTPSLRIDDKPLKDIIGGLYYPRSPYEFSVLSPAILGQVYERFLSKTILLKGTSVTVEEKPEVKKAGGVYYTPSFVVDYIVRQTLEPLLQGKSVPQAARLRVLDPACGSGSFLVAAYQYLLDWHLERYVAMKRRPKQIHQTPTGTWRLTTAERKRILLNSIFGVDIDPQAVEVAKLSLLLKVIEGETQLAFAIARLLPDLGANIRCGNSLVGSDYYTKAALPGLGLNDEDRINAFDWSTTFPAILGEGGFDAVIGNPPYFGVDATWGKGDPRLAYLRNAYSHVYNDKSDVLFYFLARAVALSRSEVAFIVSRAFLEADKADKLRHWIGHKTSLREIVDFRDAYVFEGVGITTAIVRLTKAKYGLPALIRRYQRPVLPPGMLAETLSSGVNFDAVTVPQQKLGSAPWIFAKDSVQEILDHIDASGEPLGKILHIGQGMQTGANHVFGNLDGATIASWGLPEGSYYVRARNSDVLRYQTVDRGEYLLYTDFFSHINDVPVAARSYLRLNRPQLQARAAYKRGDCLWWRWTWPLHKQYIDRPKLLCPYLATGNRFSLDATQRFLGLTDTTVLYEGDHPEDLRYLLGLLNSKALTFRFRYIGKLKSAGILEYFENTVSKLSIRRIDPKSSQHQGIVDLVEQRIGLEQKLGVAKTPLSKQQARTNISLAERKIDELVYELYGLSKGQVKIIEDTLEPPLVSENASG